jgi:polyhydroxyalkanoate synthesis regulator protein
MVNVIRSYGSNVQSSVSGHLEQSLKQYLSQHIQARDRPKVFGAADTPVRRAASEEGFKALSPVRIREADKERDDSNLTK